MTHPLLSDATSWASQHLARRVPARGQRQAVYQPYVDLARQLLTDHPQRWTQQDVVRFLFDHPQEGPKLKAAGITPGALKTALSRYLHPRRTPKPTLPAEPTSPPSPARRQPRSVAPQPAHSF